MADKENKKNKKKAQEPQEEPQEQPEATEAPDQSDPVQELQEKLDAQHEAHLRLAAEYDNFRKRTGYSIGCAFAPDWGEGHICSLQKGDKRVLVPGMVYHMPPAIRQMGEFGVGFSETIIVTEDGCEICTDYPRQLMIK